TLPAARDHIAGSDVVSAAAWYADWLSYSRVEDDGSVHPLKGAAVSGNYFDVLGVQPVVGRLLQPADDVRGGPLVAVIRHELWQSRFNGDPSVVGRTLRLKGSPATIVGATPPAFGGVSLSTYPDVWLPIAPGAALGLGTFDEEFLLNRLRWLDVVARLKPGVTFEQTKSRFESVS